jgi:3-hydroxyisobutyrate dehydrogenase-like beta-hydroxyacid dehydrogenase
MSAAGTSPTTIGIVHPGEMGAAVGASLVRAGRRVLWASEGRSAETAARAARAGLVDLATVGALAAQADLVLSVCPPHAALAVAETISAGAGSRAGWSYLDANAVAPATAQTVGGIVEGHGGVYTDGGIIGPPPTQPGTTRLYLSGPHAIEASVLLATPELEIHVVDTSPFAASALKLSYAAWTKGSAGLLLTAWEAAVRSGVDAALGEEWRTSLPDLPERLDRARKSASSKGWRWVGEMEEIALMLESLGLPPGFHHAAAEVFRDPS